MRVVLGLMAAGIGAGCQQSGRVVRPASVGASGFRFVEPPLVPERSEPLGMPEAEPDPGPMDVKFKARPQASLATPAYPPALLGRVRLPVAVGVRLSVDADGQVTHVGESLAALSTGGEFAAEFRAAIEAAVRQWRFQPAEIRTIVRMKSATGRGSYWQTLSQRPVEDVVDVAFTFTSTGMVLPEAPR